MAIQTGGAEGIEVTTAAMDETLGSQTQQTGNNTVIVSDVIGTAGNGNITAPTGYVGRRCIIRQGAGDEEDRTIIGEAAGTGNTRILTVAEDWVAVPVASTDTIHVSYSSDDMEAFTGMTKGGKTGVYEGGSSREWQIGLGTNFAYVAVFNFQGWELPDRGSAEPGLTVRNNGRLDFGYVQGGAPIQGAFVTAINNTDAELSIEIENGGIFRAYATSFRSWLNVLSMIVRGGADAIGQRFQIKDFTDDLLLLDGNWSGGSIAGNAGAAEFVRLAEESALSDTVLADTAGLHTEDADTTTETITVRGITFVGNSPQCTINSNKTWNIVSPKNLTISEADQSDLDFLTGTSNEVNWQQRLFPTVQEADGTKLNGARVFLYEGLRLDDLVLELTTDSNGQADGDWTYKNYNDDGASGLTVLTDGTHAVRIDDYTKFPFVAAQVSTEDFTGTVVLAPDPAISETTQATAITDGSGVLFNTDSNPSEIFDFTAGSGTLAVGMILTFSPSGAVGTITESVSGDSVAGTIHLEARTATAIANGDTFSRTGGTAGTFSGTYTNDSKQAFTHWIEGNAKTLQVIHDYFAARTAEASGGFTAEAERIHEWGARNEERVLYLGPSGWFTNRSGTEGIFIVNYGTGTVEFFTDDAGGTFVPPQTVTVQFEAVDGDDLPIQNVLVTAYEVVTAGESNPSDPEIINALTNASGIASTSYTGALPQDFYYRYRKTSAGAQKYVNLSGLGTIESGSGASIKRSMREDDIADPSI